MGNLNDLWVASVNLSKGEDLAKTLPKTEARKLRGQLLDYRAWLETLDRDDAATRVLVTRNLDKIDPGVATLTEDIRLASKTRSPASVSVRRSMVLTCCGPCAPAAQ